MAKPALISPDKSFTRRPLTACRSRAMQRQQSMKTPRKAKHWYKETGEVTDKVLQKLGDYDRIDKETFQKIVNVVIDEISKRRDLKKGAIENQTEVVIEKLADFLKNTPPEKNNLADIIAFLYLQYQLELGILSQQDLLRLLIHLQQ